MGKIQYKINIDLVMDKTIGDIKYTDSIVRSKGGSVNAGVNQDYGIACMYVWKQLSNYRFTPEGLKLTLRTLYDVDQKFGEDSINLHRTNYMTYMVLDMVYNWMIDKKLFKGNAKKYWKKIYNTFKNYQTEHKSRIDQSSFMTVIDHERLAFNYVEPMIEPLEVAIRDYLIQHRDTMVSNGQKDDITLLVKAQLGIMFCAALNNTRDDFLTRFEKAFGVDFSIEHSWSDISEIGRNFIWMMEQVGVKFVKDKDGDMVLMGVNVDSSCRVKSAWNNIVSVITDEELMDETALKAINLNPETKKDYERIVAQAEDQMLSQAIGNLGSKFKVSSL